MATTLEDRQHDLNHKEPGVAEVEDALIDLFLRLPPAERVTEFAATNRAAEIAGVSRRTIQLWVEFGLVRAVRVGKRYHVSLTSLRRYLTT